MTEIENLYSRKFIEGQKVTISQLGDNKTYSGLFRGISTDYILRTFIVEMIDKLPNQEYSCITVTEACIDR